MTDYEKNKIISLKENGNSANSISKELNISLNTVKSFLRRNKNLTDNGKIIINSRIESQVFNHCLNCGKEINQNKNTKKRKFCSIECKNEWYKNHSEYIKRKANYEIECESCHKTFISYGNKNRKYCSHSCYIDSRFKNAS